MGLGEVGEHRLCFLRLQAALMGNTEQELVSPIVVGKMISEAGDL